MHWGYWFSFSSQLMVSLTHFFGFSLSLHVFPLKVLMSFLHICACAPSSTYAFIYWYLVLLVDHALPPPFLFVYASVKLQEVWFSTLEFSSKFQTWNLRDFLFLKNMLDFFVGFWGLKCYIFNWLSIIIIICIIYISLIFMLVLHNLIFNSHCKKNSHVDLLCVTFYTLWDLKLTKRIFA